MRGVGANVKKEIQKQMREDGMMPNDYDLKLSEYKISKYAYRELKYFCKQYDEKIRLLYDAKDGRKNKLRCDIELIEQAAIEAAGAASYRYLLLSVTQGIAYEYLSNPPFGRRQFYQMRRKFFYLLHEKRDTFGCILCANMNVAGW